MKQKNSYTGKSYKNKKKIFLIQKSKLTLMKVSSCKKHKSAKKLEKDLNKGFINYLLMTVQQKKWMDQKQA